MTAERNDPKTTLASPGKNVAAPRSAAAGNAEVISESSQRAPTLIMGIGNILLRDEGIGVRVVEAMRDVVLPEGVELLDAGTAGADLLDLVADRAKVIVIDAIDADAQPGTVLRLKAEDLAPDEGAPISLHQLGLAQSLAMADQLGCAPREVVVFGIQPKTIETGLELTETVAAAIPSVIEAVLEAVRSV